MHCASGAHKEVEEESDDRKECNEQNAAELGDERTTPKENIPCCKEDEENEREGAKCKERLDPPEHRIFAHKGECGVKEGLERC